MKLMLFKSKTCGPCKMFEPQVKKAAETLNVDYIPVDVEENENFNFWKNLTTLDLLKKFEVMNSGKLVFLLNEMKEDGPTIVFERPMRAEELVNSINAMIEASK